MSATERILTMDWIAIPVCILVGAMIIWIHFHEAREHHSMADHIRALHTARTFAAAMSGNSAEAHSRPDDIACRVQRVVATVCEQAVSPEKVTIDPQRLTPTDDLVFDLGCGLDSLGLIDMRTSLEKEFGIRLTSGEFYAVRTVGDAISLVQTKLGRPT
jgi:acyl carrier protein